MYTDDNLKTTCFTFLAATIASLSILALGLFLQTKELDYITPPFEVVERITGNGEGFIISRDGTIINNSSSRYYMPQITGMDNPRTDTVKKVLYVELTGYSSTVDQTNSEPFITASGSWVRHGIVAANFLEFGTRIRIPEYFGDEIFTVKDRMNRRYSQPSSPEYDGYVDIWFPRRQDARNFGRVRSTIEILY